MAKNFGDLISLDLGNAAITDAIDTMFSSTSFGSVERAISESLFGINHRLTPTALPANKDSNGLTFFVRPMLNLSSDNLRMFRQLIALTSNNTESMARIVRAYLDPVEQLRYPEVSIPLVDNRSAFIPILTNTLMSFSGPPDIEAPTWTSPNGLYNESYTMVDGISRIFSAYDCTANFRNLKGDPITYLFLVWIHYMSGAFEGLLWPHTSTINDNCFDYQTRIYRLVLDETKTRVQKMMMTGAAIPTAVPIGGAFNFESDRPFNSSNDQISIRFSCNGAVYMDEIIFKYFNDTVAFFNNDMHDRFRNRKMTRIPSEYLVLFNNRGYPRVDYDTYELEWYVSRDDYNDILGEDFVIGGTQNTYQLKQSLIR